VPPDNNVGESGFSFDRFGVRVPAVLVSPLIAPGTVYRAPPGSTPLDHTSILKTVEQRWGQRPLTRRDAGAPGFGDVLTLATPRTDDVLAGVTPPVTLAPDPGAPPIPPEAAADGPLSDPSTRRPSITLVEDEGNSLGSGTKAARAGIVTVPTGNAPGRIFMSYRREDTAYPAAWLFDRLASHFGRDQVFKDVDSIELGDDFVEVISAAVGSCHVLLALIGDRWLTIADGDGRPRLENHGDFVRLEIEAALARNVRVIPILVDGARMPSAEELPASLAKLARRQALELSPIRFDADTQRLLRVLDRVVAGAQEQEARPVE
jgi:hypothetical protein